MFKLIQTFLILVQTYPSLSKLVQNCPNMFILFKTCPNLSKLKFSKLIQTCLNLFKLVLWIITLRMVIKYCVGIWMHLATNMSAKFIVYIIPTFVCEIRNEIVVTENKRKYQKMWFNQSKFIIDKSWYPRVKNAVWLKKIEQILFEKGHNWVKIKEDI